MNEEGGEASLSVTLSGEAAEWLDAVAGDHDLAPETYLQRLAAAHRAVEAEGVDATSVEELAQRVEALEGEVDEKIADVRERTVQVKREADEKAPADHDHPAVRAAVEDATDRVEALERRVEALERRVEAGFENYESVLEYLTERGDDHAAKLTTLARATMDARAGVEALSEAHGDRAGVADLKADANRQGVRTAACEACGETVDVALLTEAKCPHCRRPLVDVEPGRGLFGSNTLRTGSETPALEGESDDAATGILDEDVDLEAIEGDAGDEGEKRPDRPEVHND